MHKIFLMPMLAFLLIGSAFGNERVSMELIESINSPLERCQAQYYYVNAANDKTSFTEIHVECGEQLSIIWQAADIGHQIAIEWLSADKLKITYPPELNPIWQEREMKEIQRAPDWRDSKVRIIEIEYDPPLEEEEAFMLDESNWPVDCDEAAQFIFIELNEENIQNLKETKKDDLIRYHHGWGTGIRNSLGLWRGNDDLMSSCMAKEPNSQFHPDTASMIIIELVWKLTQEEQ